MTTMPNTLTTSNAKPIWQSKTLWFNLISALVAVLALPELATLNLDPKMVALIMGVLNIILRFWTKEPVSVTGS